MDRLGLDSFVSLSLSAWFDKISRWKSRCKWCGRSQGFLAHRLWWYHRRWLAAMFSITETWNRHDDFTGVDRDANGCWSRTESCLAPLSSNLPCFTIDKLWFRFGGCAGSNFSTTITQKWFSCLEDTEQECSCLLLLISSSIINRPAADQFVFVMDHPFTFNLAGDKSNSVHF